MQCFNWKMEKGVYKPKPLLYIKRPTAMMCPLRLRTDLHNQIVYMRCGGECKNGKVNGRNESFWCFCTQTCIGTPMPMGQWQQQQHELFDHLSRHLSRLRIHSLINIQYVGTSDMVYLIARKHTVINTIASVACVMEDGVRLAMNLYDWSSIRR